MKHEPHGRYKALDRVCKRCDLLEALATVSGRILLRLLSTGYPFGRAPLAAVQAEQKSGSQGAVVAAHEL